MPAVVSHYIMSEKLIDDIHEFYPSLKLNRTAFIWGGNGPDFFFCHRIMPWQRGKSYNKIGTLMHKMPAENILGYLVAYAKNHESDTALSYALGFISHYAFDSTAHPYILCRASELAKSEIGLHESTCHNDIEANLDVLLYEHFYNKPLTTINLKTLSPLDSNVMTVIADMMHSLMVMYSLPTMTKREIITAQHDWHNGLALINDKTHFKRKVLSIGEKAVKLPPVLSSLLRPANKKIEYDYANLYHKEWHSPFNPDEIRTDSFYELFDKAHLRSIELISTAMRGDSLKELVHGIPFG